MRIDRSYLGNQNTYAENNPKCIVVHNTDNFAAGADARAHARAQHDGNFQNISAHYYVDDGDTAYQAAPHSRGCWHVGINYGGKNLFQQYDNKNSIGVEMCVQAGYNYEKAFENTAALVREIMRETGIPLERVYRHYDICSKYCPSQIMNRGDWDRMKRMIGSGAGWINCHTAYCRYAGPAKEKSAETAKSSGKTVAEDGIWGESLTRRLQELFGTPQDGKISNQLAANRKFCDGITAAEWDNTPKGGSALVKEMQKWASAGMDGYIGPQTILAWQKKLGTPIDGTVSSPSAMVKKLQKWCNQK